MHGAGTRQTKHAGLSGISGVSTAGREILEASKNRSEKAKLAPDIYCYRLKIYIGAYAAALGGLDVLVFTAGVGENSPDVRRAACEKLEFLGVRVDPEKNNAAKAVEADIATSDSRVRVLVVPTNEALVIARDTERIVIRQQPPYPT